MPPGLRHTAAALPGALAPPIEPGTRTPEIAIIGSGFGGLGMAGRLRQAGIDTFTIYEKANDVGGTWRDNTYPGAACDVPSHLYSLSFAPKADWTRKYPQQPEIHAYLRSLVDRFGLGPHLRFGTEVAEATFDESAERWNLRFVDGTEAHADVVIAATGQLNRPHIPDLPGLDEFQGTWFHSARWPHVAPDDKATDLDVADTPLDLAGRDVAVVGIGASAIQFVPELAKVAKTLTLYQRSSNYVAPKRDGPLDERTRRRFMRSPMLVRLYRLSIWARFEARWLVLRRGSHIGALGRKRFERELAKIVSPELTNEALIPDYPIGCKRILISNDWYPAILQPHVQVVTGGVDAVTATGVVAAGEERPADTIVFGTGFQSTGFLTPMRIVGRGGTDLHQLWAEGAEAHLGLTVPGFPNLFVLYGPNTNLGHNSIIFMIERQVAYALTCIRRLIESGDASIEVRADIQRASQRSLERRLDQTVWTASCHSWYKTATGKITNNWPGLTAGYWLRTAWPRRRDFETRAAPSTDEQRVDGSSGAVARV